MNLIDEFRDPATIKALAKLVKSEVRAPLNIMEICGGHTHSIMKYALPSILPREVSFVHGPGCPVCVMPRAKIDTAIKLASQPNVVFCTLGDLMRVPGSEFSLLSLRARGADVRALYSPLEILSIAAQNPSKSVIFFAIGFETTTPMTALLIEKCLNLGLRNVFFHINHVVVPAPIEAILGGGEARIDAFLGPSHVSVITGHGIYEPLVKKFQKAIVVSGFEPVDIMQSVLLCVRAVNENKPSVINQYSRAVTREGNAKAQALVARYFEPCDFEFRGLGLVKGGGMALRAEFDAINAAKCFDCEVVSSGENKACICAKILKGIAKPYECKVFGKACTPKSPLGSCMVSSEGACAAYYKYMRAN